MKKLKVNDIVLIIGPKNNNSKGSIIQTIRNKKYCWLREMNRYIGEVSVIRGEDYNNGYFYLKGYTAYFHKNWLLKIG